MAVLGAELRRCLPLLLVFSLGCRPTLPTPNPNEPIPVTVSVAAEYELIDFSEFLGRTEPSKTVEVRARVSGFVEDVTFDDGQRVNANKPLFVIQREAYLAIHRQSEARFEAATVKAELATAKLNRVKRLFDTNVVSREEYEEAVTSEKVALAEASAAGADLARAALDLSYTIVTATIDGKIDRALITEGNLVTGGVGNGTLLTRIVQDDQIHIMFDVDEATVLRYRRMLEAAGLQLSSLPPLRDRQPPCRVRLADEAGFPHLARIDFAENRLDSATGTLKLRAVLDNPSGLMNGGMFVKVRVPMSDRYTAVLVPDSAIGSEQTVKFVTVVTADNKVERREVTLGDLRGTARVIRSGLSAGERVVSRGWQRTRPGQTVKVDRELPLEVDPILLHGDLPELPPPSPASPSDSTESSDATLSEPSPGTVEPTAVPENSVQDAPTIPSGM